MASARFTELWTANLINGGRVKIVRNMKGELFTWLYRKNVILPDKLGPYNVTLKQLVKDTTSALKVECATFC